MANAFDEVRFPEAIAFGVSGGPEFFTSIEATHGGWEQRVQNWDIARCRFSSKHELKDQTELDELLAFFYARRGMARGFRFRDWTDYCSDMPGIVAAGLQTTDSNALPAAGVLTPMVFVASCTNGVLDYQLVKVYATVAGDDYSRPILKVATDGTAGAADPDAAFRLFLNDVEQTEGAGNDYVINSATGVVTLNSTPSDGDVLSADFLFDVPVRFTKDVLAASKDHPNTHEWSGINLMELRLA